MSGDEHDVGHDRAIHGYTAGAVRQLPVVPDG